jgi:hypothetical protein
MRGAVRDVWIGLFVCLLISSTAAAQDIVSISRTVTTRADGLAVPDAVVTIVGIDVKATRSSGSSPATST